MLPAIYEKHGHRASYFLLLFVAATLCFPVVNALNAIGIILFVLLWGVSGDWSSRWQILKKSPFAVLAGLFFLLHALAMLYTRNLAAGLNLLVDCLPLALLPLVLATQPAYEERQVHTLLAVFVVSCFVASALCLGHSVQIASNAAEAATYEANEFWFYSYFTRPLDLSPIYFALYIGFCLFFLGAVLLRYGYKLHPAERFVLVFMCVYFAGVLFLLASRTALVSTVLLAGANYVCFICRQQRRKWHVASLVLGPVLMLVVVLNSAFLTKRFADVRNLSNRGIRENMEERQAVQKEWRGASVRLAIWKASAEVIENHFLLGVGTGDTQEELAAAYRRNDYIFEKDYGRHNAHNQIVQTQLATGISGAVLLLALFGALAWRAWQTRNLFLLTFTVYVFLNCLTEALLTRPKGIVFFSLVGSLLYFAKTDIWETVPVSRKKSV